MVHIREQAGPEAVKGHARHRLAAFAQDAPYRYGKWDLNMWATHATVVPEMPGMG